MPLKAIPTPRPVVVVAPRGDPPFRIDASAVEEDTALVLSADPAVRDPGRHPIRIMTGMHEQQLVEPGTVVCQGQAPIRLLAVVHDLDQDPTWREAWVTGALKHVLDICVERRIRNLALEPLGARHGRLGVQRFRDLLERELEDRDSRFPVRIWLVDWPG